MPLKSIIRFLSFVHTRLNLQNALSWSDNVNPKTPHLETNEDQDIHIISSMMTQLIVVRLSFVLEVNKLNTCRCNVHLSRFWPIEKLGTLTNAENKHVWKRPSKKTHLQKHAGNKMVQRRRLLLKGFSFLIILIVPISLLLYSPSPVLTFCSGGHWDLSVRLCVICFAQLTSLILTYWKSHI